MGKIGSYSYPDISLDAAIKIAKMIAERYHGQITRSGLAKELKMAEKGGGFYAKMAAMKDYRLADGQTELKLSNLGQKVALPRSEDERGAAQAEAFLSIDLFSRLRDRIGEAVPDQHTFSIFLGEITGADRIEVDKKVPTIYRLYSQSARLVPAAIMREEAPTRAGFPHHPSRLEVTSKTPQDFVELSSGPTHLRLAKSKTNIDIIIAALEAMKAELESGEE